MMLPPIEHKISPRTAPKLRLKWKFYAGKDITATPAIYGGALYFPSWNGYIYAVKEADGSLIWMKNLLMLTGLNATDGVVPNVNSTVSRSTPTVAGDLLIFGTYSPAAIIALKIKTGELVWKITLDDHPEALITMSGTYYNGSDTMLEYLHWKHLYPLSDAAHSVESFVKLNARSGVIMWRT
ncbi:hypothetical protein JHK84_051495 [Glycine max]|nr:hypothetical protein JHK84_051495 [Glycine max]